MLRCPTVNVRQGARPHPLSVKSFQLLTFSLIIKMPVLNFLWIFQDKKLSFTSGTQSLACCR
uniref:Uncharacterized protein n=1 Tax=Anguilla anguilla TaxID=7936 RepID=A0A0E9WYY2_ANGAN